MTAQNMLGKSRLYPVGVNVVPVHTMAAHVGRDNYRSTHRRQMEVGGQHHHHAPAALPQEITWVTIEKGAGSALEPVRTK